MGFGLPFDDASHAIDLRGAGADHGTSGRSNHANRRFTEATQRAASLSSENRMSTRRQFDAECVFTSDGSDVAVAVTTSSGGVGTEPM